MPRYGRRAMAKKAMLFRWRLHLVQVLLFLLIAQIANPQDVEKLLTTQENRQNDYQSSDDDVLTTTATYNKNIEATTGSKDMNSQMTTKEGGINTRSVDAMPTTTASHSVDDKQTTGSEDINSKMTTKKDDLDNKHTTVDVILTTTELDSTVLSTSNSEVVYSEPTTQSYDLDNKAMLTTTPDIVENQNNESQRWDAQAQFLMLMLNFPDILKLGKKSVDISCDLRLNMDVLEDFGLSIYRKTSEFMIKKLISVSKNKNTSAKLWSDEVLVSKRGIKNDPDYCGNIECTLRLYIDKHNAQCEDADAYVCILSGRTSTEHLEAISVSGRPILYPAVDPTYTDDIEVSDPGYVNGENQHEYPVFTGLEFRCSGSIGSERLRHKWHVAYLNDPCSTNFNVNSKTHHYLGSESCNSKGVSTALFSVPDVAQPIVVWCWVSYAKSLEEECAQLQESNLMKSFTILPVTNEKVDDGCIGPTLRSYISKPEKTTFRQGESLQVTCRYNTSQEQVWYFRSKPSEAWEYSFYSLEESNGWKIATLKLSNMSLFYRGWYTCAMIDFCNMYDDITNENQTLFVDVLYEQCRENGILIPGESCVEIMSTSSCAANNGTLASIHTEKKSKLITGFAFHALAIETNIKIGLSLNANTMLWKNLVWADGSPLTFMENIRNTNCPLCLDSYPVAMAIRYRMMGALISWDVSTQDENVACEWPVGRRYSGLKIPPSTSAYVGNKAVFQCTSGEYITSIYVCDGTPDCSDVSDELNCARGCVGETFQCDYGGCIPVSKSCDFIKDCADGSDETLCNYPPCDDGYWQCANKECIPVYDVCDGDVECVDGSDEADVLCTGNSDIPTEYTFRCFDPDRILPSARKCDGIFDCREINEEICKPTYFSCSLWAAERAPDTISSDVAIDYGMSQYGPLNVQCTVHDDQVHTKLPFSQDQDIAIPYVVFVSSEALWFETKWTSCNFNQSNTSLLFNKRPCWRRLHLVYNTSVHVATSCTVKTWSSSGQVVAVSYTPCTGRTIMVAMECARTWVHFSLESLQRSEYFDGNEDYGWIPITNKDQLPITSLRSNFVNVMGVSPLICSEGLRHNQKNLTIFRKCKNGVNYDPAHQCLMDFNPTGEPSACRDLTHLQNCENFVCPAEYAKCPGSFCLHMRYICDGTNHCSHNEDERDCESPNCTNHYKCRGGRPCVPFTYMCDGIRHCPLGDDELHCEVKCPMGCSCQGLAITCETGKDGIYLHNFTSEARRISMKTNMKNLTNHFPVSFPLLTSLILQSCSLEHLRVNGQSIFRNITALRYLDLSSNFIRHLSGGMFRDIASLRTLILSYNPLDSISDGVFGDLKNLQTLHISHSNIKESGLEYKVFSGLPALEYLDLSSNLIRILPDGMFRKLNSLHTLILSDNPLVSLDPHTFAQLYSLSNLQLSQLNSKRLLPGVFDDLNALTVLNLSSSRIHDLGLNSFHDLGNLKILDIQNNHFEVQEFMFIGLENLQYLYADSFKMCCIKPTSVLEENCFAPKDPISSCSNLIGSDFLRICLWLIGFSALLGNMFVIFYRVVIDNVNLKKSHSIFVINLSVSDSIMGIYMIIIASVDTHFSGRYVVNDKQWRQGSLCTTAGSLSVISSEMSTFAILMITIDRLIAIVFPLSLTKISWKTAAMVSGLLWLVSLILALVPNALFPGYFKGEFYSRTGVCLALPLTGGRIPGQEYSLAIFIGLNGLLFLVIFIAQLCIHRSCKERGSITTTKNRKQDIAIARSLFLVVATDFLCWFPVGLIGAWSQLGGAVSADVYAWVMVFVLPINSAINPFLYTYIYIKRRREINATNQRAKREPDTGFNASNNLKEIYFSKLFKPKRSYICLERYTLDRKVSPGQAFQIARRIIKAVLFLHNRLTIHGNVSDKNIYIGTTAKAVTPASLMLEKDPIGGDQDAHTDIMQYGVLVKKLLRILDRR